MANKGNKYIGGIYEKSFIKKCCLSNKMNSLNNTRYRQFENPNDDFYFLQETIMPVMKKINASHTARSA